MCVITSRAVRHRNAPSTGHCDWLIHLWGTTLSGPAEDRSCDIKGQPQLATQSLFFFFTLLKADQALGIFIACSKHIDSLKPVPS